MIFIINFYGKVTSRTVLFQDGESKTLGIMMPGEYEFGTGKEEIMKIIAGVLEVKLPDNNNCIFISAGQTFEVAANSKFQLNVKKITDCYCFYIED